MIFVTVGHQMPFDRMLQLIDRWSIDHGRDDLFAQVGESTFRSAQFECRPWLSPDEYRERLEGASAIISHAGTGTIIQGLLLGKPMLVLPRLAKNDETRNDHQVGTARYFESRGLLMAAYDDVGFAAALEDFESFRPREELGDYASDSLIEKISSFISAEPRPKD
ncbi:MAG: glucuronosyltransferase [bacterium]|nr:glucuronosyltransferase [bacterium]